jgi:hypothetical protein
LPASRISAKVAASSRAGAGLRPLVKRAYVVSLFWHPGGADAPDWSAG